MTAPDSGADHRNTSGEDAVEFAYRVIRSDILAGHLPPGGVLSQVRIAAELGISRTPLREALRLLAAENLINGDFNRRMRVAEVSLEDFDQIYAMRIALEPVAVASTLPKLDFAARAALTAHTDDMDSAIARLDLESFRISHRAFHLGLVTGSGPRIRRALEDLWDHSERYRLLYLRHDYAAPNSASAERLRTSQADHRLILAAALDGDVAACSDALVAHLHRTLVVVFTEQAKRPRVALDTVQRRVNR